MRWLKLLKDFQEEANPSVICELIDRLEVAEKEVAHIKEVEFPRKMRAVAAGWETKCARLEQERDALRAAMEKIADWHGAWGPYPETNKSWCAMAIVTAREAVKSLTNLCAKENEYVATD